jgi:hypothetical protein
MKKLMLSGQFENYLNRIYVMDEEEGRQRTPLPQAPTMQDGGSGHTIEEHPRGGVAKQGGGGDLNTEF